MSAWSRSAPTLLAPILARRSSPTSMGTRERRTQRSATSRCSCAAAHDLDRRGGQRLGEHVLRRGRERPEAATPPRSGWWAMALVQREQLAVVEDGLVDDHVVLVQAAADPRVVAQEHVALGDARVRRAVPQRPVDGEVDRPDEHRVVQADLHLLAELVGDGEVEVVGVGDDRRAGHALERLAHLVGDRPEPVADHLVGERVEAVDLLLGRRCARAARSAASGRSSSGSTGRLENSSEPGIGMVTVRLR